MLINLTVNVEKKDASTKAMQFFAWSKDYTQYFYPSPKEVTIFFGGLYCTKVIVYFIPHTNHAWEL